MQSGVKPHYCLPVLASAPLAVLPRRKLQVSFARPRPLLRALGKGEQADSRPWCAWLAGWGWAWAVSAEACEPQDLLVRVWLEHKQWPQDFDSRMLALAMALGLRVDGQALSEPVGDLDLERIWRVVSNVPCNELAEVLALALLRADTAIFDFDSVAPDWPSEASRVLAERRVFRDDEREPGPAWLRSGYALLGENAIGALRSLGSSLQDCQDIWEAYARDHEVPMAFEMAFWWEATYCLTERHDYEAAEKAQEKVGALARTLEGWSGLIDPMWHHQQGRLYYYAGNYGLALVEFLREYQSHGQDLKVAAMLQREIANVLSDLACLEAAQGFAENSVALARAQGQRTELYKSLGRLAEILIKRGDLEGAEQHLSESLTIQKKLGDENRSPAQTLAYLGHVAVLRGRLEQAGQWYALCEEQHDPASMPYLTMGRFALAAAAGNAVELDRLWQDNQRQVERWLSHQTLVLPAAVCMLAAAKHHEGARKLMTSAVQALIDSRYVIEAAYMLPELAQEDRAPFVHAITGVLNGWKKNLTSLPPAFANLTGPLRGPAQLGEEIRKANLRDNAALQFVCYPMTLTKGA